MVALSPGRVQVNGPLGELSQVVPLRMSIEKQEETIVVTRPTDRGEDRSLHGLTRTLIANMVDGVTKGFEKRLEIQGVGYRASMRGTDLELAVGFSHPVVITPRAGITFEVPQPTQIIVKGHRQADGRPDGRRDPQGAPARALQGQGDPLRGRARPPQGRKESVGNEAVHSRSQGTPPPARARQGRRHRRASAPRRLPLEHWASTPSSSTTPSARTLASAGWKALPKSFKGNKTDQAREVGKVLADRAKKAGYQSVVFDRAGYLYHGRVKALAEGAREGRTEVLSMSDFSETRELKERVVEINRVAKVVKGGRRFSFSALVVIGDEVDRVGVGYGKAREVPLAISKAVDDAKKNMFTVPKHGTTITHEILGEFDAARVLLRPASEGTGVIAGGGVRAVLELGGVKDILAKSLGTTNPINMLKATVNGLQNLRRPEDVARMRGKTIAEVLPLKATAPADAEEPAAAAAPEPAAEAPAADEPVAEEPPAEEPTA